MVTTRSGDTFNKVVRYRTEVLFQDFEIAPGVILAPGRYEFRAQAIDIRTAGFRKFTGRLAYVYGGFFSGDQKRIIGELTWQPSPKFRSRWGLALSDVDLPEGAFTSRLVTAGIDWVMSSRLSWVNLIQYDNFSETVGVNMRLHWIPESGRDFFFVINHTLEDFDRDNSFHSTFSDATAKISYTFRF